MDPVLVPSGDVMVSVGRHALQTFNRRWKTGRAGLNSTRRVYFYLFTVLAVEVRLVPSVEHGGGRTVVWIGSVSGQNILGLNSQQIMKNVKYLSPHEAKRGINHLF